MPEYNVKLIVTCEIWLALEADSPEQARERAVPYYAEDRLAYLQYADDTVDVAGVEERA